MSKFKQSKFMQFFMTDILKGHQTTFKHLFRKKVTLQYPVERYETPPNFLGILELVKDEEGNEICNGCGLCQRACPADCLDIEKEGKGKEQKAKVFNFDLSRCMFCNHCVEACPSNCLIMGKHYEESVLDLDKMHYKKEDMYKKREFEKYKK